jgi:tRNA threonylcarbamoyladenosine biosynthesis protein TsaB
LSLRESTVRNAHSAALTTFIEEVYKSAGMMISETDAVAISEGPGSYTGLRIGVASAKGLCYALDKPLIAIPTLKAMAFGMLGTGDIVRHRSQAPLLCPMIDARRMEVFSSVYDPGMVEVRETRAEIIDKDSFSVLLKEHVVYFAGDGAAKCKPYLEENDNAFFIDDFRLSATCMVRFAEQQFISGKFENLAYFEPYYLKDFVAGKPRVKGLI